MANECEVVKKSLGVSACTKLPQLIRGMITTPNNFKFTAAQAADPVLMAAALQAAILAPASSRVHVWPYFDMFENVSEEQVYEDTPLSYLPVRDGNYRFKVGIAQSLCLHKKMFTHRAKTGRVFLFDNENQLTGTVNADGEFLGLSIQLLHTEKLMFNDGSVVTKSPILIAMRNNKELDKDGGIVDASFFDTVNKLTDVLITVVSADDDELVVAVTIECDGTPVNGLEDEDFIFLDGDGDAQTISGGSETGDGVYTLTGSGFVDGTIKLVAPSALSVVDDLALESYATDVTVAS